VDYKRMVGGGDQTWFGKEGDTLTQYGYFGDWDKTFDQDGNKLEEEIEIHANLQGQKQFYSNFGIVHRNRLHSGQYYDETQGMAYAQITPVSGVSLSSFTRFGKQIDFDNNRLGDVFDLESSVTWQLGKHIEMELSHNYNSLKIDGDQLYAANQTDIRLSYQFDIRSYVRLVVQYTDITRDPDMYFDEGIDNQPIDINAHSKYFNTQLLYSYKLNPQTLVYLGYSDSGFQDDDLSRIEKTDRTVFAKFSYAWQM
ncbi:MAG: hydrolase, partial [Psychrosphaera sp.]|nr:hydrolase [Psychrosphaera sp.]